MGTFGATGEQYRPAVGACRAPEFSLQGPIEIGALRLMKETAAGTDHANDVGPC